ncbi:MAG: hypothetical protein ACI4WS_12915 [Oscillospiraceae bacterium]
MSFYASIACDGDRCSNELPMYYMSKEAVRQIALERGWIVDEYGEALCPKCQAKMCKHKETKTIS